MPKEITLEMVRAMSPDQRKSLQSNAARMDTQASRAVLELLTQEGLMPTPRLPKAPAKRKTAKKVAPGVAGRSATKGKTVSFGRQA